MCEGHNVREIEHLLREACGAEHVRFGFNPHIGDYLEVRVRPVREQLARMVAWELGWTVSQKAVLLTGDVRLLFKIEDEEEEDNDNDERQTGDQEHDPRVHPPAGSGGAGASHVLSRGDASKAVDSR